VSSNKITIIDVAKEAGLSIASVSRYINNSATLRKASRQRIAIAIKKLDYQPLVHAQRLAGGKLNTLGLIIPGYEGIFYSFYALEIIRNVCIALEKIGFDLHINIFWNKDNFRPSLVDGVIFADIINNEDQLLRLVKSDFPCVVINKKIDEIDVNSVSINNFKGAFDATDFLVKHGHKRIAHLAGDLNVQCAQERLDGHIHALKSNSLKVDNDYIKMVSFSRSQAREALTTLFSLKNKPTAIFAASDEMAQEVVSFAKENDIEVPGGISVVGFDDNPRCVVGDLALTTVRQPLEKMVFTAVDILKRRINNEDMPSEKTVIDSELIIRDTVDFV